MAETPAPGAPAPAPTPAPSPAPTPAPAPAPQGGAPTPTVGEDGTVKVGDKVYIPKESYDIVAEKQRKADKELERIQKEKDAAEKKRLEEAGEFKTLAEQEKARADGLEAKYLTESKVNALKLAAMQAGTVDAEAVATLANLESITLTEDGKVDADSVKAVVDTLKKEKAYLFGTPAPQGTQPKPPIGSNGGAPAPGAGTGEPKTFYRSQLRDSTFYQANRADILLAAKEGRIVDDL